MGRSRTVPGCSRADPVIGMRATAVGNGRHGAPIGARIGCARPGGAACATSSTTGRAYRAAANSSASRSRRRGADYVDVARQRRRRGGDDAPARRRARWRARPLRRPSSRRAGMLIGQTANILLFLGPRHGLVPDDEAGRLWTHQLQLTIADLVVEVHDSHHPIASGLYYEEQRREARKRAADLREHRLPKFLGYFERVLKRNSREADYLVGRRADVRGPVAVPGGRGPALRVSEGDGGARTAAVRRSFACTSACARARASPRISRRRAACRSAKRASSATTRSSTPEPNGNLAARPAYDDRLRETVAAP